ncbi:hypothetical protein [Streptomyces sp. NPDC056105]|uniref:hypothetical protein n=1 Tax=Streptomyces sp. NPDC056105 TaxID=3345714 RepID=UPI0035D52C1A
MVITVVDVHSPPDVHLGPLLVIAPALTASVAGPRLTALVGALAVAAQMLIAVLHGGFWTSNHISQIVSLTVLSVLIVIFCRARERRSRQLNRVRSVSETAQLVLLKPLSHAVRGALHGRGRSGGRRALHRPGCAAVEAGTSGECSEPRHQRVCPL